MIAFSVLVALLTFATVYCACIAPYRWYKILISGVFSVLVAVLVTSNFYMF